MTIKNGNSKITIDDIAKELGVANSTVSRALRGDARISQEMIQKVRQTANRLGYVPNVAARSLRTGQSSTIGLIVRDIRDSFSTETMRSVEQSCAENGYGLFLCNANDDPEKEQFYLHMLHQRRVDGVLILTPTSTTAKEYLPTHRSMPVVLVDSRIDDKSMCAISVDHVLGGYLATKHLLDLGHRKIVYLTGPLHLAPCSSAVQGFRQAMQEAGVPADEHSVVVTQGTGLVDGLTGTLEVFERFPQATAMATISDLMAVGAFSAARQQGVRIPADFSIVGYDDVPLSAVMSPSLTTIAQDKWMLGTIAVNLLMEEIRSEDHKHCQVILPPSLVIRESTTRLAG